MYVVIWKFYLFSNNSFSSLPIHACSFQNGGFMTPGTGELLILIFGQIKQKIPFTKNGRILVSVEIAFIPF